MESKKKIHVLGMRLTHVILHKQLIKLALYIPPTTSHWGLI